MRILVLDDHNLFLQGTVALLGSHLPQAEVIAFQNSEQCYDQLSNYSDTDLLISDIYMPLAGGITPMEKIQQLGFLIPVLLVSAADDLNVIKQYFDLGAAGFVHKNSPPSKLLEAIKAIIYDGIYIDNTLNQQLHEFELYHLSLLTKRQSAVLQLLAQGMSNQLIAQRLGITESTVKLHVSALLDALGASNRLECVRKASDLNLITNGG